MEDHGQDTTGVCVIKDSEAVIKQLLDKPPELTTENNTFGFTNTVKDTESYDKLIGFRDTMAEIRGAFSQMEIVPIAVLPFKYFMNVTKAAGLFTFLEIDSNGDVGYVHEKLNNWMITIQLLLSAAIIIGGARWYSQVYDIDLKYPGKVVAVGFGLAIFCGILSHVCTGRYGKMFNTFNLVKYVAKWKPSMLWPTHNDTNFSGIRDYKATLKFVSPSEDTYLKEIIGRCGDDKILHVDPHTSEGPVLNRYGNWCLGIAAAPGSFTLSNPSKKPIPPGDPIIFFYNENKQHIVVVHQYGTFPTEKKTMKYLRGLKVKDVIDTI